MTALERPPLDKEPDEDRDEFDLPGAERGSDPLPPSGPGRDRDPGQDRDRDPETERRDTLADRVQHGGPGAAGSIESDLRPDVDVPDEQM